ncbi:MAG: hypothetical protein JNM40_20800 [Myxococcales bacterium]|nr:hypothetical protein [Myxococcales bacterium]
MMEWLMFPGEFTAELPRRLGKVWKGSALCSVLRLAKANVVTVVEPLDVRAVRSPNWPDVLSDWSDIHEESLFPSPLLPVAGEVLSESGPDVLCLFADPSQPERVRGGIAFYERGALRELEQVGRAAVAWQKGQPLGRPRVTDFRSQLFSFGKKMADTRRDADLFQRADAARAITAEMVVARALLKVLDIDPPSLPDLAQALERSGRAKLTMQ